LTDLFYIINDHVPTTGGATIQTDSKFYGTTIFVLLSTNAGRINVALSCLNASENGLNIRLGWACLHVNYWRDDRHMRDGTMNKVSTIFTNVKKLRQQIPIMLSMCCADFFTIFDPNALVRTQLGDGEIDEATYEEPSERLTLNLKHD
jgi:hypothetical protein